MRAHACTHRVEAGEGCGWKHRWRESRHQEAAERVSSDSKRPREIKLEMRNNKRGMGREGERGQGQQTGREEIERGGK